jgi:hypothetical protein
VRPYAHRYAYLPADPRWVQAWPQILADVGDNNGQRDGLNLLVNATLSYLTGEAEDLTDVVALNYDAAYGEVLSWIEEGS